MVYSGGPIWCMWAYIGYLQSPKQPPKTCKDCWEVKDVIFLNLLEILWILHALCRRLFFHTPLWLDMVGWFLISNDMGGGTCSHSSAILPGQNRTGSRGGESESRRHGLLPRNLRRLLPWSQPWSSRAQQVQDRQFQRRDRSKSWRLGVESHLRVQDLENFAGTTSKIFCWLNSIILGTLLDGLRWLSHFHILIVLDWNMLGLQRSSLFHPPWRTHHICVWSAWEICLLSDVGCLHGMKYRLVLEEWEYSKNPDPSQSSRIHGRNIPSTHVLGLGIFCSLGHTNGSLEIIRCRVFFLYGEFTWPELKGWKKKDDLQPTIGDLNKPYASSHIIREWQGCSITSSA